jgi:hypothetical protein
MENHILLPTKEIQNNTISRRIMATLFWDQKCLLPVDFLDHGDTVTAECYYGTLQIWQDFSLKQPGVMRQGGFILCKKNKAIYCQPDL